MSRHHFFKILFFICLFLFIDSKVVFAQSNRYRGWDYLVSKLISKGVPLAELIKVYGSSRMPIRSFVPFEPKPAESHRSYQEFFSPQRISKARRFLVNHRITLNKAYATFGIDPEVIAAIMLVETGYGEYTGNHQVIVRVSRAASVTEEANILQNYRRLLERGDRVSLADVRARAQYVEGIFLPEVIALFNLARKNRIDIFQIKGSIAGAFGLPQFMPSSYLRFGTDGNYDGKISLFQIEDAIMSVAKYFAYHGWKRGIPFEAKRKVVFAYNKSDPYVNTILKIADIL
jgi:membrane-bound lytic murein transglycosylase B